MARQRKKCKQCNNLFVPVRDFQKCCSYDCDIAYVSNKDNLKSLVEEGEKKKVKEANKKKLAFKQNDKSHLIKVAQREVNKYIRLRDKNEPCISCGTPNAKWDAGHFESQGGNLHQRFYTLNIWKQCYRCNQELSSNRAKYRPALIEKLGLEKVEEIENDHGTKKYSVEYLQKLIKVFRKKIKLYENKFRTN